MLQIVDRDLKIHNVPLEKIQISDGSIKIILDDIYEKSKCLIFKPYQAIKITTVDCADLSFLETYPELFPSGIYQRYLLEETESSWIPKLRESLVVPDDDFLIQSRHFILDLRDNIVEIVAWDIQISDEIESSNSQK
jgi:hypothetical protein